MYHNETKATLKKTGNIMGKLHMQAQLTKLHLTPAFRAGKRFAYKQTQAEAHEEKNARGWEVKSEEYKIATTGLMIKSEGLFLGRWIGWEPERSPRQIEEARAKGDKATNMLAWIGAFSKNADTNVAEFLYKYLVESVLVAAIYHTQLKGKDKEKLRAAQAQIVRRSMWAGKRVSFFIILMELGWEPIDTEVNKRKLNLHDTIKRLPEREYAKIVYNKRMEQVQAGSRRGLCYESKELWREAGE